MRLYEADEPGVPTLQLDRPLLRSLVLAETLALDLLIERLPVPGNASGLGRLLPEACDITEHWETKLEAMLQYESQIRSHLLDREVLEREFRAYSGRIGAPPGRLLERYWRTGPKPRPGISAGWRDVPTSPAT